KTAAGILLSGPDTLKNDLIRNQFEWQFQPSYTYQYNRFRATLGVPLQYIMLRIHDHLPQTKTPTDRLFLNPSLFLSYKLTACWETSFTARYTNSLGSLSNSYTGYIMRSYRNLQRNEDKLLEQQVQNYNFSLSYRNPIYSLFGNFSAGYNNIHANLLFGANFQDILRVQTTYEIPNTTALANLSASLSKGLDVIASTLTVGGNYTSSQASQLSQEALIHYTVEQYGLNAGLSTKLWKWGSLSYKIDYAQNRRKMDNDNQTIAPIRTVSQRGQLNLFPLKNLVLNLSYENFYNSAIVSGNRNISFGDLNLRYKWPKIEVMLDYTNIFNAKEYVSASYSDISTFYSVYYLRPTEVVVKVRFKLK
ncbi:MAG: hypothetical protein FWG54_02190, partial [Bacteroidetes bacterium]|nr:hypothetical protein [Bacteroidota bacterium]